MANIQLLQGTEKIKDSYTKINTSLTNINNELTGHITGSTLWSGNAYQSGTVLNLSGNLNDFSYIVVQVDFYGYQNHIVYHKETANWYIKGINLPDDGLSTNLMQVEIRLSRTSNTSITIVHNHVWQWSGNVNNNATIASDNSNFYIRKIVGVI